MSNKGESINRKHTTKINHVKLQGYIKATGMTYRKFGEKLGFQSWLEWKAYLYGDSQMPFEVLEKTLEILNLDDTDLVADAMDADTLDMKRAMLNTVIRLHHKMDMGIISEMEFLDACRTVAPYVIAKVYGAGSFDSNAFAQALLAGQAALARGEAPEGLSEVERQQLEI